MEAVVYVNNSLPLVLGLPNISVMDKIRHKTCGHMPEVIFFYFGLQFTNMFMGLPANIMVLWLIRRDRCNSSTSDLFIVHLAVLDTFFCLLPPLEMITLMYPTTRGTWYVLHFFYGVKDLSPLFLSCICLDGYMAVRHPVVFSNLKDRCHRPICAGVVWLITLAHAIAKCIGTIPNFSKAFTAVILASFGFMVFCNMSILWALRQSSPGRDEAHPVKKRAFKMALIILAIIVFNYFPPVALYPFKDCFSQDVFECYIHYIAFSFMDISSSIQPVLYLSRVKPKWPECCCNFSTSEHTDLSTVHNTNV